MFRFQLADFVATSLGNILMVIFCVFVFMESEALAYLDPGTGSFFLQVIAASLVAVAFFARKFWGKITAFFSFKRYKGGYLKSND